MASPAKPMQCTGYLFANYGLNAMKWYYEWRLNRVLASISVLEEATQGKLADDYTAYSRLRVLVRLAHGMQQRLAKFPSYPPESDPKEAC